MAVKVLVLVISCGALLAGWSYVRIAGRMRSYKTTRGTVISREFAAMPLDTREGRWGNGGGYRPKVTYTYTVDGVAYTSDRWSYQNTGLKHSRAEQLLRALPDEVDVHYDQRDPRQAYLQTNSPRVGYVLLVGGVLGVLASLAALVA